MMEIKVNIKNLIDEALTANEYIHMYLVSQGRCSDAWICAPLLNNELRGLSHTGYIRLSPFDTVEGWDNLPAEPKIQLQDKALALFKEPVSEFRWKEFKDAYPIKSGERRLHDSLEKNKSKFQNLVSVSGVFEDMMRGLENEKLARIMAHKKGTFMPEWKAMSAWLNQKNWLTYLDYQIDTPKERVKGI